MSAPTMPTIAGPLAAAEAEASIRSAWNMAQHAVDHVRAASLHLGSVVDTRRAQSIRLLQATAATDAVENARRCLQDALSALDSLASLHDLAGRSGQLASL